MKGIPRGPQEPPPPSALKNLANPPPINGNPRPMTPPKLNSSLQAGRGFVFLCSKLNVFWGAPADLPCVGGGG